LASISTSDEHDLFCHLPHGGENPRGADPLPEFNIEAAIILIAFDEPGHDDSLAFHRSVVYLHFLIST